MKKGIILVTLLLVSLLYACGDDVDCADTLQIQNEVNEATDLVNAEVLAFNADQSDDNCRNVVEALEEFIETLEDFQECADQSGQGQQFRDDIATASNSIGQLPCG